MVKVTPQIVNDALDQATIAHPASSVANIVLGPETYQDVCSDFAIFDGSRAGYYIGNLRVVRDFNLFDTQMLLVCADGTTHRFHLQDQDEPPPTCWCGLSASVRAGGYGGLHADYCHPTLAGRPA